MGRTKKETKQEENKNIQEVKQSNSLKISYSGDVNITVMSGKKKLKTLTFHNNGGTQLFKFLCGCLAGRYSEMEGLRPLRIKLYYSKQQIPTVAIIGHSFEKCEARSDFITTNESPDLERITETTSGITTEKWQTVLHFNVPYASFIEGTGGNGNKMFNQLALFSTNATEDDEYSAIFLSTKDDGKSWDNIDTSLMGKNYTLVIQWTMTVENK